MSKNEYSGYREYSENTFTGCEYRRCERCWLCFVWCVGGVCVWGVGG
jgi:hypothetical protein